MFCQISRQNLLDSCLPNINVHTKYQGNLSKCKIWFRRSGGRTQGLHFSEAPRGQAEGSRSAGHKVNDSSLKTFWPLEILKRIKRWEEENSFCVLPSPDGHRQLVGLSVFSSPSSLPYIDSIIIIIIIITHIQGGTRCWLCKNKCKPSMPGQRGIHLHKREETKDRQKVTIQLQLLNGGHTPTSTSTCRLGLANTKCSAFPSTHYRPEED